ncbi:MAG: hypothetical protein ACI33P_14700 [Lysinibacillus sp.]
MEKNLYEIVENKRQEGSWSKMTLIVNMGNRSFRRCSVGGLGKGCLAFGLEALAHNLMKVAGVLLAILLKPYQNGKHVKKTGSVFSTCFVSGAY